MSDRKSVIDSIINNKIILIFRGIPADKVLKTADAAYKGGIRLMEFAFDAQGKTEDSYVAGLISLVKEHFGGFVSVGAGTVLEEKQVFTACDAGADFIISPVVNEAVIRTTLEKEMVSVPGALTPTEAMNAHTFGADFVKLFPAGQAGGPAYMKAICTPLSQIRFLAVAGIEIKDAADYIRAGACGLGISSGILKPELIRKGDYAGITDIARKYCNVINN